MPGPGPENLYEYRWEPAWDLELPTGSDRPEVRPLAPEYLIGEEVWAYPILKRTPRWLVVAADPVPLAEFGTPGESWDYARTYRIGRASLERRGEIRLDLDGNEVGHFDADWSLNKRGSMIDIALTLPQTLYNQG